MTKSFENITVDSLHGVKYSGADLKMESIESSETPVLDLSFKRSPPPPSPDDYLKVPAASPLMESAYPEHQQETNNNDNKHTSSYEHSESVQMALAQHYRPEEATTFPSNHERQSPFENRSCVMTPPSELDSPKKPRIQALYEHTNHLISDSRRQPVYPTAMMPISMALPLPISVPSVLPTLLPQSSPVPAAVPAAVPAVVPAAVSASVSASVPLMMPSAPSPSSHEVSQATVAAEEAKKAPRPFKAYPKDPLSITLGPDMMFDQDLKKAYSDFRNRMLDSVKRTNEGTNIKMRRVSKSPTLPTSTCDEKDAAYWERRRKNNEAAKRSRDARRAKEDEIAIRAAFLEQEYIRLKYENAVLKDENTKIKCMLYGH